MYWEHSPYIPDAFWVLVHIFCGTGKSKSVLIASVFNCWLYTEIQVDMLTQSLQVGHCYTEILIMTHFLFLLLQNIFLLEVEMEESWKYCPEHNENSLHSLGYTAAAESHSSWQPSSNHCHNWLLHLTSPKMSTEFFIGAQMAVRLQQTTQTKSGIPFITTHNALHQRK